MRPLRATSLVLAFLAATGLVLGSFAFSAMSADRGVDVGVVDDDEAYVGYADVSDGEIHPNEETPIARYHNRFMLDLDEFRVDVRVIEGTADVDVDDQPDGLDAGDGAYVNVSVHCDPSETITLALDAEGSGAGVSVSFTREVTMECVPKEPRITGVTFNDAANAQFDFETDDGPGASSGAAGTETAEAVVWQKPTPPNEESDASDLAAEPTDISPNDPNLRNVLAHGGGENETDDGEDWKVVAIEFPNQNVAFFHPGWDAGSFESVASSEGVEVETDDDLTAGDVIERSFVDEETADDD